MPFWWRRRRKPWYGRWRRNRRFQRYKRRPRRRRFTKRRGRRTYRRRRKRRYKVRRKKQKIPVTQWQPDSIRNCKIKGLGVLCLGAEGTQIDCYTVEKTKYVPPKVPWGGGFGIEDITLEYLYEEYKFTNNIWTASNITKDLCRYIRGKATFFRHPDTDFVVNFNRQPPHKLNKYTFIKCHPQQMLLEKHKKIILSKSSRPNGPYKRTIRFKPPKQMLSKWFFTKEFSTASLVLLTASAANFRYSHLSAKNTNMQTSIYSLNTSYFQIPDWAAAKDTYYHPYGTVTMPVTYKPRGSTLTKTIDYSQKIPTEFKNNKYLYSISYEYGWFRKEFMFAEMVNKAGTTLAVTPLIIGRYNPEIDNGKGNEVYLVSTLQTSWGQITDKNLYWSEMPLWMCLYGLYSYVRQTKTDDYLDAHVVVIVSKAIYCYPQVGSCTRYCPLDYDYLDGKLPYGQTLTAKQKSYWYPNMHWQKKTLNAIVESGPFVPQYSEETNSTWELKYSYLFYFKWGGPYTEEPDIKNPQELDTYDVPDKMPKTIQIKNPTKQAAESILHPWDWRRGIIKKSALKRMYENLQTDTEFQPSSEESSPKKIRKGAAPRDPQEKTQEIDHCLQELFKKSTFQDPETQTVQQLIQQQQEQQEQLKFNILSLIFKLKEKQRIIQQQTGLLD
nr:MAG: ORF1 [Torque teno midi virus]